MKVYLLILFTGMVFISNAQNQRIDSLKQLLERAPRDTHRVELFMGIAESYFFTKPDSCLAFSEKALELARELYFIQGEVYALNEAGEALRFLGNYPRALKMQFDALQINRKMKNLYGEATTLGSIGFAYVEFREYRQGLQYLLQASKLNEQLSRESSKAFVFSNIGNAYDLLKMPDSALFYQQKAYEKLSTDSNYRPPLKSLILTRLGNVYSAKGEKDTALQFYHSALSNATLINDRVNKNKIQGKIAEIYETLHQYDSSLYYARQAFVNGQNVTQKLGVLETSNLLVKLFRIAKNPDSAFFYQDVATAMKDSLYGPQKFKQLQLLMLEEQEKQQKIIQEKEQTGNRIKYTALLSALGIFLLVAFLLLRNNRQKQKANILLREQKNKIEDTLTELKSTQTQLIQSEKMASLGELTAGIAHEIQNPLNFVNNFSEVNKELLIEMKDEIDKGNLQEVRSIADDVIDNEQKINHHGKRADAIVKGMLQHSRANSGKKEPTDINALCDEYLRLSYHGLRAKDKTFNATSKTDFDPSLEKINIIPQDIGRVILNLLTNAFYAVNEKKTLRQARGDTHFEPTVSIQTKKINNKVEIKVTDNGSGIPQKVLDKIFQPFFTTKPTGQGTGLGLSLSYDIIKAHGGEIKVETKEGEGSKFIIQLPIKENV